MWNRNNDLVVRVRFDSGRRSTCQVAPRPRHSEHDLKPHTGQVECLMMGTNCNRISVMEDRQGVTAHGKDEQNADADAKTPRQQRRHPNTAP